VNERRRVRHRSLQELGTVLHARRRAAVCARRRRRRARRIRSIPRCALPATSTELVRDGERSLAALPRSTSARLEPDVLPPAARADMFTDLGGCDLDQFTGAGAAVELAQEHRVRPWAIGGVRFAGKKDSNLQPVDSGCRRCRLPRSRSSAGTPVGPVALPRRGGRAFADGEGGSALRTLDLSAVYDGVVGGIPPVRPSYRLGTSTPPVARVAAPEMPPHRVMSVPVQTAT
jgi:hypothetical protein